MLETIVKYDNEDIRNFLNMVNRNYEESKKISIPYDFWMERSNKKGLEEVGTPKPKHIRFTSVETLINQFKEIESQAVKLKESADACDSIEERTQLMCQLDTLFKETFKPECEFDFNGVEYIDDIPIWYDTTRKGIDMTIGPEDLDISRPVGIKLNNKTVHGNAQGNTGSGKSKLMLDIIFNLMLRLPPWELNLVLIDCKESEFPLFARAVNSAHCSIIAATKNKEFLTNLFSYLSDKLMNMQTILNQTQCSDLAAFNNKFDLVVPRELVVFDEVIAMIKAINDTGLMGNSKASDELSAIFSSMQRLTTLGRNVGEHIFISSQDLGSKMSDEVMGQLHVGVCLASSSEISNSGLNNKAAADIDRLGYCIANNSRLMADNEDKNKMIGVPLIDTDPVKGELFTIPQKLLIKLKGISDSYGFKKSFYFYDATVKISNAKYVSIMEEYKDYLISHKNSVIAKIPVGETISYTELAIEGFELEYRKDDGVIIDASDKNILKYEVGIIAESLTRQLENLTTNIYYISDKTKETLDEVFCKYDTNYKKIKYFDQRILNIFSTRLMAITVQENMNLRGCKWSFIDALQIICNIYYNRYNLFSKYKNKLIRVENFMLSKNINDIGNDSIFTGIKEVEGEGWIEKPIDSEDSPRIADCISKTYTMFCMRKDMNLLDEDSLEASMFKPILNYWFNIEDLDDIALETKTERIKEFFSKSPTVKIINVVNSESWGKLSRYSNYFNHVLEFSNKDFFSDLNLGSYYANINSDSLLVHDRRKSKKYILKIFGGII